MSGLQSGYLFFFGSTVLFIGLLSGVPMWLAIIKRKSGETISAWRVAHTTLTMDGIMMIVTGLLLPQLPLAESAVRTAVWALLSSGSGFVFAMITGAYKGISGLRPKPYGLNTLLFCGHAIGAAGSLTGISIVLYGSFKTF